LQIIIKIPCVLYKIAGEEEKEKKTNKL
jgi:hypothetical protein